MFLSFFHALGYYIIVNIFLAIIQSSLFKGPIGWFFNKKFKVYPKIILKIIKKKNFAKVFKHVIFKYFYVFLNTSMYFYILRIKSHKLKDDYFMP